MDHWVWGGGIAGGPYIGCGEVAIVGWTIYWMWGGGHSGVDHWGWGGGCR